MKKVKGNVVNKTVIYRGRRESTETKGERKSNGGREG